MIYQVVGILLAKIQNLKTSMLRSNLCDYSDVYIAVNGRINVRSTNDDNKRYKKLIFRIMLHLDHAYQKSIIHL